LAEEEPRLRIFFLPPYSPEFNPDEWVWKNVKNDRIAREVIMSNDDFKAKDIQRAPPPPETRLFQDHLNSVELRRCPGCRDVITLRRV
jgi:DDE superfamily endonuclease